MIFLILRNRRRFLEKTKTGLKNEKQNKNFVYLRELYSKTFFHFLLNKTVVMCKNRAANSDWLKKFYDSVPQSREYHRRKGLL